MHPEKIIQVGGLTLLLVIVFLETGVFFGFFLPGDSLLVTAGFLCSLGLFKVSLPMLIISLVLASVFGTAAGYASGAYLRRVGRKTRDTIFFKRRYLIKARHFYRTYGGVALITGKFFPVIRTFLPILAGIVSISWKRFMLFNAVGSITWVVTMVLAGYYMGRVFPGAHSYLLWIIVAIIFVTLFPVLLPLSRKVFTRLKYKLSSHA